VAAAATTTTPYTPAWQERITGVPREQVIAVARQFADNADKTQGKSMVIIGAAMNHWYHSDMNYRGIINMLMMCGCIGQSGGGWAHYVGQEKLRPQTGWTALAFALDWIRPPRQMNSTSFFYAHTDQWRYEKLGMEEILSPLADRSLPGGSHDRLQRARRAHGLAAFSAPQLQTNPLQVVQGCCRPAWIPRTTWSSRSRTARLKMSCEDPDHPPTGRATCSCGAPTCWAQLGKGHEYFLKHLLGTSTACRARTWARRRQAAPSVKWHAKAPEGKLDLLVTLDFRMSTTCLYSDIVLPTATWYEKNDLNTSDMHPFIHPLSTAVDPAWQSRSDWEIYKGFAKVQRGLRRPPGRGEGSGAHAPDARHAGELAQPFGVQGLEEGRVRADPRQDRAADHRGRARLPQHLQALHRPGPADGQGGQRRQGHWLEHQTEVEQLGDLNGRSPRGRDPGHARRSRPTSTPAEVVLMLAPETNGHVAVQGLGGAGQDHRARPRAPGAAPRGREDPLPRHPGAAAQDHQLAHLVGAGSEKVSYNAGYTNVHELIPWRTLTGRQQFYQDHPWMRDFGEGFCAATARRWT
jgi:nitrate reductase alpha subunit